MANAQLNLKDPSLLETRAHVDGAWIETGRTFPVHNPATGQLIAEVADLTPQDTARAVDAAPCRPAGMGGPHGQGTSCSPAALVRSHGGERGRSRHHSHRRDGQALAGGSWRNSLRCVLHRVVRGGSETDLRGDDPRPPAGQAYRGDPPAGRRGRFDHALELSQCDDRAQGRPGACGGVLLRCPSCRTHAPGRRWPWLSLPSARGFRPGSSTSSPRPIPPALAPNFVQTRRFPRSPSPARRESDAS